MDPDSDVCDVCGGEHAIIHCPELCCDDIRTSESNTRARLTLPRYLYAEDNSGGKVSVFSHKFLAAKTKLGPYEARRTTHNLDVSDGFILKVFSDNSQQVVTLDTTSESECNWLCLVQTASTADEQNCMAIQIGLEIYYITSRVVEKGNPLRVWYAPSYARKLGKTQYPDGHTTILLGRMLRELVLISPYKCDKSYIVDDKLKGAPGVFMYLSDKSIETWQDVGSTETESICFTNESEDGCSSFNLKKINIADASNKVCIDGNPVANKSCLLISKTVKACEMLTNKREILGTKSGAVEVMKKFVCGAVYSTLEKTLSQSSTDKEHIMIGKADENCETKFLEGTVIPTHPADISSSDFQMAVCKEHTKLGFTGICKSSVSSKEGLKTAPVKLLSCTDDKNLSEFNCGYVDRNSYHTCKFCNKTFEKQSYLARHIQGHINMFSCVKCNKKFSRKQSLNLHVCPRTLLTDGVEHSCEICGAQFHLEKYLMRHVATHTQGFKCEKCQKSFSRKESLLQHMARCHPECHGDVPLYPCSQCARVFVKELSLHNHMKLHDEAFKCLTCAKPFTSAFNLARHSCVGDAVAEGLACETEDGCYECRKCGKVLSRRAALQRHLALHTKTFSCCICGKKHSRKEELSRHSIECAARAGLQKVGVAECSICHMLFSTLHEYEDHYLEHTHPYKCDICGRRFLRQANLCDHRCGLQGRGPFKCKTCQKSFSGVKHLQRHSVTHGVGHHICDHCGRSFKRLDYLNDHICLDKDGKRVRVRRTRYSEEVIQNQSAVICPVCGKNYASISNLNKHIKTHGEKKEVCEVCGKSFHLKVLLKEHMKYVHTNSFSVQCQHCSKQMKSRNSLYSHLALFHPETVNKEVVSYKCDRCGKVFRQKGNLKKHELTHSDKRSFSCQKCDKTFKFPEQMRRHELWHRYGPRFKCQFCDRQFVMEFELKKHVETYHGRSQYICKYCNIVCHHSQAIKRHLRRCHFNISEWQTAGSEFIRSLQVFNNTYINIKLAAAMDRVTPALESALKKSESCSADTTSETIVPADVAPQDYSDDPRLMTIASTVEAGERSVAKNFLSNPSAFVLQTMQGTQFDPHSVINNDMNDSLNNLSNHINTEHAQHSFISLYDLNSNDSLMQLPTSLAEGSVPGLNGSEYILVSILNNSHTN